MRSKKLTRLQKVREWFKDLKMSFFFMLLRIYLAFLGFFGVKKEEAENFVY